MAWPLRIMEDGLVGHLRLSCRVIVFTGVQISCVMGEIAGGNRHPDTMSLFKNLAG